MAAKAGRVDVSRGRPRIYIFGRYIYSDRGQPFENVEHAEAILAGIRHQLTKRPRDIVLARYLPVTSDAFSVARWLPRWIDHHEAQVAAGQRSPGTLREYRRYAAAGGEFEAMRPLSLYEITFQQLDDWRAVLLQRSNQRTGAPITPKLAKNVLSAFRAFLRWCRRRVPDLVIPDFPAVAVPQHPYVKVSPKTRLAVIEAIPQLRRGAFLAACLGLRPGEIRALDVRDFADGELTIARALKTPKATDPAGPTKGLRSRSLPVTEELAAWLSAWRVDARPDEPLFPNPTARCRSRRWHANALREEWVRACRAVGVRVKMYEGTKHSFATELVEAGVDLGLVQRFLGHADRRSTDHYTHRATSALVAVLQPRTK